MSALGLWLSVLLLGEWCWCTSGHGTGIAWDAAPSSPRETMVDVVNRLGLAVLKEHNRNNENNMALSPYGVASILAALLEGVGGQAGWEMNRCGGFPLDRDVVRVGIRDIHRRLRSYFIPQEGFLSGLSLSSEKVLLRPDYQSVLRFYGFDLTSFNTPIYPEVTTATTTANANATAAAPITTTTTTTTTEPPEMRMQTQAPETTTQPETSTTTQVTTTTLQTTTASPTTVMTTTEPTTMETTTSSPTTTPEPSTTVTSTTEESTTAPTTTTEPTTAAATSPPTSTETSAGTTTEQVTTTSADPEATTTTTGETTAETTQQPSTPRQRRSAHGDYYFYQGDKMDVGAAPPPLLRPSFLVRGKYEEHGAMFMSYDVILPLHYVHELDALALRFPLDSPMYYLLLVLPGHEHGIDTLICDMAKAPPLKHIVRAMKPTYVKALIPSFTLRGFVILTASLQRMGIRQIFEPRQADFSQMTDDKDVYVTNIEQAITVTIKNYMDANTINNKKRQLYRYEPVHFRATHPFLYFVMDSEMDVALVAGKIVNPINSRIQ